MKAEPSSPHPDPAPPWTPGTRTLVQATQDTVFSLLRCVSIPAAFGRQDWEGP